MAKLLLVKNQHEYNITEHLSSKSNDDGVFFYSIYLQPKRLENFRICIVIGHMFYVLYMELLL